MLEGKSILSVLFSTLICISASAQSNGNQRLVTKSVEFGEKVKTISLDVTKAKQLVLTTSKVDGVEMSDQSMWLDSYLTTSEGEKLLLYDLKPVVSEAGVSSYSWVPNLMYTFYDIWSEQFTVVDQTFSQGVFISSPSKLVYNLDERFVEFTTKIGIHKRGRKGTIQFCAKALDETIYTPESVADAITPQQARKNAEIAINRLADKSTYIKMLKSIDTHQDQSVKATLYKNLEQRVNYVADLNDKLVWVNIDALKLAFDDMSKDDSFDKINAKKKLDFIIANLPKLKGGLANDDQNMIDLAKKVVIAKRSLLVGNTLFDMDSIVVARYKLGAKARSAMGGDLGTQIQNYNSQPSAPRFGFDAEISMLSDLRDDQVTVTTLYEPENTTSIADLHLHWSGDKLMFTMSENAVKWNVFELSLDDKKVRDVIDSPEKDLDFCDPAYLPDGRVLATSTIGYHGVPCISGFDEVCNLVLYDPATKNLRRLTFDQDGNWNPVIMNNGRVMYTRWEYTDLTHYFSRIVMNMNPDGTGNRALYGSGSFWPNSTYDMKPIPNSANKFIATVTGHHGVSRTGRLVMFDPAKSRKEAEGVVQEFPYKDRKVVPEIKDYLVDGVWPQFTKPFPLNDKYFLVSAKLSPRGLWGTYLVDVFDNLTLITETEGEGFIYALPTKKRAIPPVIADVVDLESENATIFIQDIYEGEGLRGVPRGTVKKLRVYAFEYGYLDSPTEHYAQGIQAGWDMKRLLGTVPVEKDGSVLFNVPSNMPVSLQPLDSLDRAVQWMRSWITSMPGEVVSCIGCHEDQNKVVMPKRAIASQIKPHEITPPEGGVRSITFDLEIQPVLDRACIACHDGNSKIDFTGGRTVEAPVDWTGFTKYFGASYLEFHKYFYRQGPEADMYVLEPYEYHVSNSEMVRMLEKGHHGVKLDKKEWLSIYRWLDMNTPYLGTFEQIVEVNGHDQYKRRIELADKYNNAGVDWRGEIERYAKYLKDKPATTPTMPVVEAPKTVKEPKVKGWPLVGLNHTVERKVVEVAPGVEITFVKIPEGEFAMGSNYAEHDQSPRFKAKVEKSFWITESEITNEQYKALVPQHDSRYIGQFWKDHTSPGYPANLPTQPAIRMSWEEAMKYGEILSAKTGLNITLPTETQWEWAARCGTDTEFWYGDLNTDFSRFENLGDKMLSDMAVIGVDPKPMAKTDPWFKFYDYMPKEESVNDGSLILTHVKSYEPNPWGIYDINGNVAEWTRSDYVSYPLTNRSRVIAPEKVVRGGSWMDRPKHSTVTYRKRFLPWQSVVNVGMRLVIEQ